LRIGLRCLPVSQLTFEERGCGWRRLSAGMGGEIMSGFETFEVPNFRLQNGGILPTARLAYATRGALNPARDNAVLVPSWYTGTHDDSELFMLGEGRALDPNKYFIILTNLLANGLSSSPSNSPAPVERGRFPKVTIHDNVRLQHMLVTEKLGIERLRLVTGFSMGACQTFQWAAQFPDMVGAACPIAGSARTGNFNKVFLLALRRALELDPAYADGFYRRPPVNGLKAFAAIYAGWGTSEPFFREEAFRPLGSRSMAEHVADFWEPFFLKCDANDLLSQLWTWEAGDISANSTYDGNFEAALRAIKARTIIVPIDNDRYFPPVDSENEARHIRDAKVTVVASVWGHMALMNAADIPAIDAPLNELLAD
jgi:homoserine O-acetyltransferase/O-succinyltransferase